MSARLQFVLAIFPQPPTFLQPGERALDNPTLWHHREDMSFQSLGNFYRRPKNLIFKSLLKQVGGAFRWAALCCLASYAFREQTGQAERVNEFETHYLIINLLIFYFM